MKKEKDDTIDKNREHKKDTDSDIMFGVTIHSEGELSSRHLGMIKSKIKSGICIRVRMYRQTQELTFKI